MRIVFGILVLFFGSACSRHISSVKQPEQPVPCKHGVQGTTNDLWGVAFLNPSTAVAVGRGTILRTTDSGASWSIPCQTAIHGFSAVCFANNGTGWAVGSAILRTTDEGENWSFQKTGEPDWALRGVACINADTAIAVGGVDAYEAIIIRTVDSGESWVLQSRGNSNLTAISFGDTRTGTAVGTFFSYRAPETVIIHTTDVGEHWEAQSEVGVGVGSLSGVHFSDANNGTAVGNFGGGNFTRTADGGATWRSQRLGPIGTTLNAVWFADANTGTVVGNSGTIMRTTDGGDTWTDQTTGTENLHSVSFADADTGIAVGDRGTILHTTDGGETWIRQMGN